MKRVIHTTIIIAVTVLLVTLFARGTDVRDVWHQVTGADKRFLFAALVASSMAYVLRATRWQFLLRPIGHPSFGSVFRATAMGFAATFLLPGRTGEILRPYLLARGTSMSAVAAFATIAMERLLDLIGVLLLFAAFLCFPHPEVAARSASVFWAMRIGGLGAAAASLAAFVVLVLVARYPVQTERLIDRLSAFLPRALGSRAGGIVKTFTEGFTILRRPADAAVALVGAFPLWLCSAISIWCVSEAFHLGIPPSGAFLLLMLLVLGVAVPTPGGVGGVHYAFRLGATALYAAADDRAVGAAIVFHALTIVPVSAAGLCYAAAEGLSLRRLGGLAAATSRGGSSMPAGLDPAKTGP